MTRTAKVWRVTATEIKGCKMGEPFTTEVKAETEAQAIGQVKAMLRTGEKSRVNIAVIECVAVAKITGVMDDTFFWDNAEVTTETL